MGVKISNGKAQPSVAEMVVAALKLLNNRQGTSLAAIKKQMASVYNVDPAKLAAHIKKFIKTAIEKGTLIQTKGKGAAGSFKLSKKGKENDGKTPKPKGRKKKPRTPARKALFQTPQPGRPKPKVRDLGALPFPEFEMKKVKTRS